MGPGSPNHFTIFGGNYSHDFPPEKTSLYLCEGDTFSSSPSEKNKFPYHYAVVSFLPMAYTVITLPSHIFSLPFLLMKKQYCFFYL